MEDLKSLGKKLVDSELKAKQLAGWALRKRRFNRQMAAMEQDFDSELSEILGESLEVEVELESPDEAA